MKDIKGKNGPVNSRSASSLVVRWVGVIKAIAWLLGIAGIILEYGFIRQDPATGTYIYLLTIPKIIPQTAEYIAILCFVAALWIELLTEKSKALYLKAHIIELILSIAALLTTYLLISKDGLDFATNTLKISRSSMVIFLKGYLIFQLLIVFAKFNTWFTLSVIHPARGIIIGFLMAIITGAILLSLPCASYKDNFPNFGHNFVENLFTATSAVCVTGLIVRDTATEYTPFGQLIIMILIQLGGLGIITFGTVFALLVGSQITLREASIVKDLYSEQAIGQIRRVVKFIILTTLAIELLGAIFLYNLWWDLPIQQRIFKSLFHAISAFCNAGFALQSNNMIPYAHSWQMYGVILPLIVIGGIGFPVLLNIYQLIKDKFLKIFTRDKPRPADLDLFRRTSLTLHTKIVLSTTAFLIIIGTIGILLLESIPQPKRWAKKTEYEDIAIRTNPAAMRSHPFSQKVLDALFLSVSARTAGFNTVDTSSGNLKDSTLLLIISLMFIGGSPASTAGGIKTITFAVLLATIYSMLHRRDQVEVFRRTIDTQIIKKAIIVTVLFFTLIWTIWLALLIAEPGIRPIELLFEATSACGTVGYSTGITPHLSLAGRIIIIIGMFVGRIGPLTLLFSLATEAKTPRYEYPHESLIVG